jgi:lipopolysaccharide heptosyltransferase II
MFERWANCKNILVVRADNMGDLVMSSPAIRALKESFQANITVLTSSMASGIARHLTAIDDVIIYDLPWVKAETTITSESFFDIIAQIKARQFDAAVIFSVYSQNPLPAAMLTYLAGIPLRLAYCRENPYKLLSDWIPDTEPYTEIKHQVKRDLDLVARVGAVTTDDSLTLSVPGHYWDSATAKLQSAGVNLHEPWIILHPGVSELKRQYPAEHWIAIAKATINDLGYQVLFTGGPAEKALTDLLQAATGQHSFSVAGLLNLQEFIQLIKHSPAVVSVNTGTVHLAAAVDTPIVVLYALTNPQHFPWKSKGRVLLFDVPEELRSRNEVIKYVNENYFAGPIEGVQPTEVIESLTELLSGHQELIPELPDNLFRYKLASS